MALKSTVLVNIPLTTKKFYLSILQIPCRNVHSFNINTHTLSSINFHRDYEKEFLQQVLFEREIPAYAGKTKK
jgi:hypothetical protein